MSQDKLEEIQYTILIGEYDLSRHARIEMARDYLRIFDVEHAVLSGEITKIERNDKRGTRYTIIGLAEDDKTEVGVVGRYTERGRYLVITVYEVTEG